MKNLLISTLLMAASFSVQAACAYDNQGNYRCNNGNYSYGSTNNGIDWNSNSYGNGRYSSGNITDRNGNSQGFNSNTYGNGRYTNFNFDNGQSVSCTQIGTQVFCN